MISSSKGNLNSKKTNCWIYLDTCTHGFTSVGFVVGLSQEAKIFEYIR